MTMAAQAKRWWRYVVLRGDGIPARLDGVWFDLEAAPGGVGPFLPPEYDGVATLDATNRWEQREDGEVAVVYEWMRREAAVSRPAHMWQQEAASWQRAFEEARSDYTLRGNILFKVEEVCRSTIPGSDAALLAHRILDILEAD